MPTLFERIVAGELPCHKVWEDSQHLAFLDIQPRTPGHTLVIPKQPTDYVFDLSADATTKLWLAVREVAQLLQRKLGCKRVCVAVLGWEVNHCHVHLLPTNALHDFPFPPVDQSALENLERTAVLFRP